MQVGRFINKLVNNRERFYQTTGAENLLSNKNMKTTWNLSKEAPGEYQNKFLDDMAITNTIISLAEDSSGREIHENDTIIIRFDESDREVMLDAVTKKLNLVEAMQRIQRNGIELKNPLPEVQITDG